jgi:hypothetical protein
VWSTTWTWSGPAPSVVEPALDPNDIVVAGDPPPPPPQAVTKARNSGTAACRKGARLEESMRRGSALAERDL